MTRSLGAIGRPELILLADYCIKTINLWFWLGAFLRYNYRPLRSRGIYDVVPLCPQQRFREHDAAVNQPVWRSNHLTEKGAL